MYDKLLPNTIYHIVNRGVNGTYLFINRKDYELFVSKFCRFIEPVAVTYAYCLMPNHFHFLIKIKPVHLLPKGIKNELNEDKLSNKLSQCFSNFFNSYTRSFNKFHGRKDKLFSQRFRKKMITNESYFKNLIYYIHRNPVHHKFCYDLNDWKYSSYWDFLNLEEIWYSKKAFQKYFHSKDDFKKQHHQIIENYLDEKFLLE